MFERAVNAEPDFTPALADLVSSRQYLCAWDGLDALVARLVATLDDPDSDPRLSPFVALALPFSPAQQLTVARRWSRSMLPAAASPAIISSRGDRLRIGYLSSDFRDHPTGRLMVGLFEAHDRRKVEVFGYSYGPANESPLRRRIVAAVEHWRDLGSMGDSRIAETIRGDRIDVLIDRKGHTRGGRLAALAERPATVQLHYMSFPGTLGYDAIDGLIADEIVIPSADEVLLSRACVPAPALLFRHRWQARSARTRGACRSRVARRCDCPCQPEPDLQADARRFLDLDGGAARSAARGALAVRAASAGAGEPARGSCAGRA